VLAHFADVLQAHVRDSDCVGRLGGDEFGVLLSHANQEQALKKADVLQMIAQSRAILDIQHPGQTGLTMRTIEMLGARKKLITTNPLVRGYEFFRPENILVIDRGDPVIDPGFLGVPYVELPEDLYERYSLDGWIREVFSVPACVVE
jgi:hypothetical protein